MKAHLASTNPVVRCIPKRNAKKSRVLKRKANQ